MDSAGRTKGRTAAPVCINGGGISHLAAARGHGSILDHCSAGPRSESEQQQQQKTLTRMVSLHPPTRHFPSSAPRVRWVGCLVLTAVSKSQHRFEHETASKSMCTGWKQLAC